MLGGKLRRRWASDFGGGARAGAPPHPSLAGPCRVISAAPSGNPHDRSLVVIAASESAAAVGLSTRAGPPASRAGAAAKSALPIGIEPNPARFAPGTAFLEGLATCTDLQCVHDAHHELKDPAQGFSFPHFLILGFQKAATTSLFAHLHGHPQVLHTTVKEPKFLTAGCGNAPPEGCSARDTRRYIEDTLRLGAFVEGNGTQAAFEGSTHMVRAGGTLAPRLRALMPWLKLVVSLREPISRAASMLIHNKDVGQTGCLMREELGNCLLSRSQLSGTIPGPANYSAALKPWFDAWPVEKLHVIQVR